MIAFGAWLRHRLAEVAEKANGVTSTGAEDDRTLMQLAADLAAIKQLIEDDRKVRFIEKWRQRQAALLLLGGLAVIAAIVLLPVNLELIGQTTLEAGRSWVIHHADRVMTILGLIVGLGAAFVAWLAQPQWLRGAQLMTAIVIIVVGWPYLFVRQLSVVTLPVMLVGAFVLVSARPPDLLAKSRARPKLFKKGVYVVAFGAFASLIVATWSEFAPSWNISVGLVDLAAWLLFVSGWFISPIGVFLVWRSAGQVPADSAEKERNSPKSLT